MHTLLDGAILGRVLTQLRNTHKHPKQGGKPFVQYCCNALAAYAMFVTKQMGEDACKAIINDVLSGRREAEEFRKKLMN